MIDIKLAVLRHVAICEQVSAISGPRALATLKTTQKALANVETANAVRDLHRGGFIAVAMPRRPRAPARFVLTEKGSAVIAGKVAA